MSRNFELMQHIGQAPESASTPKPRPAFSKTLEKLEKMTTEGVRFALGQVAGKETLTVLERIWASADRVNDGE
jgi:hypothetical protein